MSQPFTDNEIAQIDSAAERRVRDAEWRDRNRTRVAANLAAVIDAPLATAPTRDALPSLTDSVSA